MQLPFHSITMGIFKVDTGQCPVPDPLHPPDCSCGWKDSSPPPVASDVGEEGERGLIPWVGVAWKSRVGMRGGGEVLGLPPFRETLSTWFPPRLANRSEHHLPDGLNKATVMGISSFSVPSHCCFLPASWTTSQVNHLLSYPCLRLFFKETQTGLLSPFYRCRHWGK